MSRSFFRSLPGQFFLILLGALVVSQVLNVMLLVGERRVVARAGHFDRVIERIALEASRLPSFERRDLPLPVLDGQGFRGVMFLSEVSRADEAQRGRRMPRYEDDLAGALSAVGVEVLSVSIVTRPFATARPRPPPPRRGGGPRRFRPRSPPPEGATQQPGMEESVLSVQIRPGVWLNTLAPVYAAETVTARALLSTGVTLVLAALAAWLLARRVARPMHQLAVTADTVARGGEIAPVPETGPADVQAATRAFNLMQRKLTRVIAQQRDALRAVGHDLRTPITALRIRLESLPAGDERDRLVASLDDLSGITDDILHWAKETATEEAMAPVRLDSLLESVCQDYEDRGEPVLMIEATVDKPLPCRRMGLKRAVVNLVDNALKYGNSATLSLDDVRQKDGSSAVRIRVDDTGPGIPEAALDTVLAPFSRLEVSRNRDTGGMGLGLS
ncbi:MAG: ATP-binding protein, partial [Pseudomonadota bacterium]